ncbi:hypothetical protein BJY00DRAFT_282394 [Aspergillus carlsbadensis]|nr:hypothetical protein BJY00DRAFT_282394 [Aspergillus carlsbadensis]
MQTGAKATTERLFQSLAAELAVHCLQEIAWQIHPSPSFISASSTHFRMTSPWSAGWPNWDNITIFPPGSSIEVDHHSLSADKSHSEKQEVFLSQRYYRWCLILRAPGPLDGQYGAVSMRLSSQTPENARKRAFRMWNMNHEDGVTWKVPRSM